MAEKKLVDKLKKYSKVASQEDVFYEGEKQANIFQKILNKEGHYNGRYTEFGGISFRDWQDKVKQATEALAKYPEFSDITDKRFLSDEFLNNCGTKELKSIFKLLSKIQALMIDYSNKSEKLSSPNAQNLKEKYNNAIKCYKKVLEHGNESFLDLERLNTFDTDAFAKALQQSYKDLFGNDKSSNLNLSHERDLEVVRALEFTGIYLKRSVEDGKTKWVVDKEKTENSTNGIPYLDKDNKQQYFKLSYNGPDSQIESFLNEYLNKNENDRDGAVITPEGIFKLYLEESTSSISSFMGRAFGFGKDNKVINDAIAKSKEKFSMNSSEWQAFARGSERLAVTDASKLVLVDLFKGSLSDRKEFDQDIIEKNDLVNSHFVNKFLKVGDRFNDLSDSQIIENYEPATEDIVQKYTTARDEILQQLESKTLSADERTNLENLLKGIEQSIATIDLVKNFEIRFITKHFELENLDNEEIKRKLQDETFKNEAVQIINMLSECDFLNVERNSEGKFELSIKENIKNLDNDYVKLSNSIVDSINKYGDKHAGLDENEDLTDDQVFNRILEYATNDPAKHVIGDSLEEYEILKRTEELTDGKDNELTDVFKIYREYRDKNPDAKESESLEKFLESKKDALGLDDSVCNPLYSNKTLSIIETLSRDNSPEYKNSEDYKNTVKQRDEIVNNANMYYVLVDRIAENLSSQMPNFSITNLTPEKINTAYNNVLIEKNRKGFNATPEEISSAKAKYEDKFSKLSLANAFEESNKDSEFKQSKLSNDLSEKMIKTFGEDIKNKQNADQKPNTNEETVTRIKFTDKYPKKNESALLGKFKPYCAKSTGKIIDNLLKMIQGIELEIRTPAKSAINDEKTNVVKTPSDKERTVDDTENSKERTVDDTDNNKESTVDENDAPERVVDTEDENAKSNAKPDIDFEEQTNKNQIGIDNRAFATFKMLAVGLQAVLKTPPFEENRKLLSGEEKSKIDSLSKVLNYIVSEPKDKEEADFKYLLAEELDYKSRTTEDKYVAGSKIDNSDFFNSEFPKYAPSLVDDVNNIMINMKNLGELGMILGITTDRSKADDPHIGNLLSDEMVEDILKCKDAKELWDYMKNDKELYNNGLWKVPAIMSSELEKRLNQIIENERSEELFKKEQEARKKLEELEKQREEERLKKMQAGAFAMENGNQNSSTQDNSNNLNSNGGYYSSNEDDLER